MFSIDRLYDSHIHLVSTGELLSGLDLSFLKSSEDLSLIKRESQFFRGEWLYGFGWDENNWINKKQPTRFELDHFFPDIPVFFVRVDGHSSWLNTKALEKVGFLHPVANPKGGQILRDQSGLATGILNEMAHMKVYEQLPSMTKNQIKENILIASAEFNRNGFTHVRDMAGHQLQWEALQELEKEERLSLFIEQNFACEAIHDLQRIIGEAVAAKRQETKYLKVKGLKFYFDGSLGSDTAYLSKPYAHRADNSVGMLCWDESDVEQLVRQTWMAGLEVAVHTIGDQSAHIMVQIARKVSAAGVGGRLNLEHVEVLRNETIQMMKPLHVTCHLQPCHWLSDRRWLKEKTGDLYQYVFPWASLEAAKIPFYFGSDSPIERSSYLDNMQAINESKKAGIPPIRQPVHLYHQCPDQSIAAKTTFENNNISEVVFDDKVIFKT